MTQKPGEINLADALALIRMDQIWHDTANTAKHSFCWWLHTKADAVSVPLSG